MEQHTHTATEIVNPDEGERPDCALCGDPACSHGIYELKLGNEGFSFRCATADSLGHLCKCKGYEPPDEVPTKERVQ